MNVAITPQGICVDKAWSDEECARIQSTIDQWQSFRYHNIVIQDAAGHTVKTNGCNDPHLVLQGLDRLGFPQDLTGKTVLDIGCNLGFYSFAAKQRGAERVVGIDISSEYTQEASWLRDLLGFTEEEISFKTMSGHELAAAGEQFDVVINVGVLYHIENPMDFLRAASRVTREFMILESEMLIDPAVSDYSWFIEKEYGNDPSNWWIYGPACLEKMARAAGFGQVKFEGFLWKPEPGTRTPEGFERQGRGVLTCAKK